MRIRPQSRRIEQNVSGWKQLYAKSELPHATGGHFTKKECRDLNVKDLEWTNVSGDHVRGVAVEKILSVDSSTGANTRLVKYSPGGGHIEREHDYWEEVYVLEGECTDTKRGITLKPGNYECMPPHTKHGPYVSKTGILCFEVTYYK